MSAAIFTIGTELTRGELVNTNSAWLSEALCRLGFEVTEIACVDDDQPRIEQTLRRLAREHELLICTGGLGPTTDDLTREAAASVAGAPLQRHAASLDAIRARMARFGRRMAASNEKQADFPRGAVVLDNSEGTAPGFHLKLGQCDAFFLPGVPHEMQHLFEHAIRPRLSERLGEAVHQIRLNTFGLPESEVNDRLTGVADEFGVLLGYRAHFPEITVKVLARAPTAREAEARARPAADRVRQLLGDDIVFSEGETSLSQAVGALLVERKWTIGIAESCTGGLVSELFTRHAGSSAYFVGGLVTYANEAKLRLLGVSERDLEEHGAVSQVVAVAMATGALQALDVNIALSLTGIAGPGGGSDDKPVGLVHYAVATPTGVTHKSRVFPAARRRVQRVAAFAGLRLVRQILLHGHE